MSFLRKIALAIGFVLIFAQKSYAWKFEADTFNVNNTFNNSQFTCRTFATPFPTTPVVVILPDQRGGDASDFRMADVTPNQFCVLQVEPIGYDGEHLDMNVSFIAIEPGVHVLPDGTKIEAGFVNTMAYQGEFVTGTSFANINFSHSYTTAPSLITQIQTMNSEDNITSTTQVYPNLPVSSPWLTEAVNNVTTSSAQVALEVSEFTDLPDQIETIGYIAMEQKSGSFTASGGAIINYDSFVTGNVFEGWSDGCNSVTFPTVNSSTRAVAASKRIRPQNTSEGDIDGGWFRRCNLTNTRLGLRIDESPRPPTDNERTHAAEPASIIVFSDVFTLSLEPIGIAKQLTNLTDMGDGTFLAGYAITVENPGSQPQYDAQITDRLSAEFGSYTTSAVPDYGEYTIVNLPNFGALPTNTNLVGNPNYNGDTDIELITVNTNNQIGGLEIFQISLEIRFHPVCGKTIYNNQAIILSDASDDNIANEVSSDSSQNGLNVDPDNDGDPTNNNEVTPLTVTAAPTDADLVLTKVADVSNVDEGGAVTYTITAENKGPCDVTNLDVLDNIPAGLTIQSGVPSQGTFTP